MNEYSAVGNARLQGSYIFFILLVHDPNEKAPGRSRNAKYSGFQVWLKLRPKKSRDKRARRYVHTFTYTYFCIYKLKLKSSAENVGLSTTNSV